MKLLNLFLTTILFSTMLMAADTVKVGYFVYPPHLIPTKNNKAPIGAAVDVIEKYVAPKAKLKVEWVGPLPYARLLTMLDSGEIDAIGLTVSTPERQKKYHFSKNAPLWGVQGIVALKGAQPDKIAKGEDLKGKIIGKLLGGYLPEFLEKNKNHFMIEDVGGDNSAELNLKKVLEGRIYGSFFAFPDVLLYYASAENQLNKVQLVPYPGTEINILGYFPMSQKSNPELVKKMIAAVDSSTKEYDYLKMSQAYIDKASKK
ncbi:MAG: hypothetical protein A2622_13335 [Bdellovibrionales bacterium RIFCSPHIGHO2_01_FULL_40_29]|nr:MAG: hypothetical protein A2622_13335 [Bdellovibrionales bacterium RIFCSPHIGHO2_01_FULL_40_29]OFZ33329.1 MAG: hypothetical protein A3D17_13550 [Bdellovibrionales bacterium RIFCSPHIGHO2_02_FULL_40_15]